MKKILLFLAGIFFGMSLMAQTKPITYTITADTTLLTGCDSNELIISNHTQNVPGFLFNTGNGRTQFRRGLVSLGSGSFQIGGDTLKLGSTAWLQGGNSFGTTGVLGTLDNNPIDFYTNDTARARLTNGGRLLIGTTTDNGQLLQVNGPAYAPYFTNIPTSSSMIVPGVTNGGGAFRLRWGDNSGNYIGFFYQYRPYMRGYISAPGDARSLLISDSIGISYVNTPWVAVGAEGGLVGSAKLTILNPLSSTIDGFNAGHTTSDTSYTYDLQVKKNGDVLVGPITDNGHKLQVSGSPYFSDSVVLNTVTKGTTADSILVWDPITHCVHFVTASSLSGLVMGDYFPSSLAVRGTIKAQKLNLSPEQGWPDYVFKADYKLPSLAATAEYIRQHNHLPGIRSASDIEKDGVEVGENEVILLKKIEELTLYSIDQDKKLEEQRERMKRQDKEMADLKAEVEELRRMLVGKVKK